MLSSVLNRRSRESGFTLLETLVVLLITGIVASIAIPVVADMRKWVVDQRTEATITQVADQLRLTEAQGKKGETATLATVATKVKKSAHRDTILGLNRTTKGFCLTAFNYDGAANQQSPMVYDSSTKELSSEPTANCPESLPTATPFIVNYQKELEPLNAVEARPTDICNGIVPGETTDPIFGRTTTGEAVRLMGSFTLNGDCKSIDYDLRVLNADPDKTYEIAVTATTEKLTILEDGTTHGYWDNSGNFIITIPGTKTINTALVDSAAEPLPTGWEQGSQPQSLHLAGGFSHDEYDPTNSRINWDN